MVIFGVTGDLARKKVVPAIYDLANRGLLAPNFALVGFARREWDDEDFANEVQQAVKAHSRTPFRQAIWDRLAEGCRFVEGTFDDDASFAKLAEILDKLDADRGIGGNHAFYYAIPPKSFPNVCEQLAKAGLAKAQQDSWSRVVIEKPFGHDLESARELNKVSKRLSRGTGIPHRPLPGQGNRPEHLALRFAKHVRANLEPHYVDHVQITMAEDIGVGGRGGYYDGSALHAISCKTT